MELDPLKVLRLFKEGGISNLRLELLKDINLKSLFIMSILDECGDLLKESQDQFVAQLYARLRQTDNAELNRFVLDMVDLSKQSWLKSIYPFPTQESALITTIDAHRDFIGSIRCFSDKGFISSSEDSRIMVWDLETGRFSESLREHREPVNYIYLSPDGKYFASASDDYNIKIWEIKNWTVIKTLEGHSDYVSKVAITKTGLIVSVSKDQTVKVWDFNTGKCLHTLEGHNSWVYMLAVSPEGRRAITASVNSTMIVWDLMKGTRIKTIIDAGGDVDYVMDLIVGGTNHSGVGHEEYPLAALWLDDGRIISVAEDIIIWDDKNYIAAKRLEGHPWKIHDLVLLDDKKTLFTVAFSIKAWNIETGVELLSLKGHDGAEIYSAAVTKDSKYLLTGDKKGTLKIWDIPKLLGGDRIKGHNSYAFSIKVTTDGRFAATGGYDKTAVIWDLEKGMPIHHLTGHVELGVHIIGFRNEDKEVVTISTGQLCVWKVDTGEKISEIFYRNKLFYPDECVLIENGNKVFAGAISYRPTLWNLLQKTVKNYDVNYGFYGEMVLTSDKNYILTTTYPTNLLKEEIDDEEEEEEYEEGLQPSSGPVILWGLKEETVIREYWHPESNDYPDASKDDYDAVKLYPSKILFSPNEDQIIAGFSDGSICIWDKETGKILEYTKIGNKYITFISLDSKNRIVSKDQDEMNIRILDIHSLKRVNRIDIKGNNFQCYYVSIQNDVLCGVLNKNSLALIDLENGKMLASFTMPSDIRDLNVIEKRILVACDDGLLYQFEFISQN